MKILTICPSNFVGVKAVFNNGLKLGLWEFVELEKIDPNEFDRYDQIIFGAYHPEYENLFPLVKGKKSILVTSSILQIEMSPNYIELYYFNHILELLSKEIIDQVFVGDRELFEAFKSDRINRFYYPFYINNEK